MDQMIPSRVCMIALGYTHTLFLAPEDVTFWIFNSNPNELHVRIHEQIGTFLRKEWKVYKALLLKAESVGL